MLDGATEMHPEKEAVIFHNENRLLMYAEFQSQVDQLSASLSTLGLEKVIEL